RTWHYHLRVTTVEPDGARGLLVTMRGRDLGRLKARGGQFFYWRFLGSPGRTRANPFSLAAQGEDEFTVAVRVVGDGTQRISRLRPGTRVYFEGPYGNVTGDRRHGHRLLMIGAGAGVGPLMSILDEQHWEPGEATLISRENVESDVMMRTQIELMVAERGLNWDLQIGPPGQKDGGLTWLPAQAGPAAEVLAGLLEDPQATDVYLCGPPPWMSGVTRDVVAAGVPPGQIHSESFNF
ncbi:MAG: oxidoreductase, partial [Promicromonosporaceae bacterium]|nr:oxidoreductase [Promicromonosporaceae bacterium]